MASQQILRHREGMARIRRHLLAALVTGVNPVLAHQPLYPLLARTVATPLQFAHHAWASIGALEFGMNGLESASICESVSPLRPATPPRFLAR